MCDCPDSPDQKGPETDIEKFRDAKLRLAAAKRQRHAIDREISEIQQSMKTLCNRINSMGQSDV